MLVVALIILLTLVDAKFECITDNERPMINGFKSYVSEILIEYGDDKRVQIRATVDSQNNRVKVDTVRSFFQYSQEDREINVLEGNRLMVSSPQKRMCIRYDLEHESQVKGLEFDQMNYCGKQLTERNGRVFYIYVFETTQPFYDMEHYLHPREDIQTQLVVDSNSLSLIGGYNSHGRWFSVQTFEAITDSQEYELQFFQKECLQQYDEGEYMLIDGEHVVKRSNT